jgi:hypothetical protein
MDLITELPPVEGYDSILVMVDRGLLKGVILCPCAKTITWEGTATLLRDNLFKRFGLPDEIISDRDPRFPRSLPELLEGKEVYGVETILRHWWRGKGYQYYMKWKGYPITEATWEHASAFSSDGNMLKEYQDWHQL